MVKKSCAINLKKGEERASMSECLDRKQVKYYGIEKVNKQTLDELTSSKMSKAQRNKLVLQMQQLKRKILKGKEEYKKMEAGEQKKKKLEELKKIDKLRIDVVKMLKKFDEKKDKKEKQNKGVDLEDTMSKRLNEMRKQQKKSKEKAKATQKRVNPWLIHVKKVKEQNKQMAYKDILIKAKQTYNNESVKSELKEKAQMKLKNCDMKKVDIPCNYKNKKMNSYVELIKSLQQQEKNASTRKQKEGLKKIIDRVKKQFSEYLKQLPKKKTSTPYKSPPKIPPELPDWILEQEFPKAKPKAKPINLFNEFKNVMKELIDLIYNDEIYIFYNPKLSDKWNESAVKQHKKNLIMMNIPKSLNINELYYDDNETYPFEELSRSFLNLLNQPSVKNSLSSELKEDINKVKKLINIINKELENKRENESEDEREEEEDLFNFSDLSGSKRNKLRNELLETTEIIKPSKKKQGVSKKEQALDDIIKKTEARLKEMKQERVRSKDSAKTAEKRVNPWLEHVKMVKEQKENKEMAYKDVLKEAKKTYKSEPKAKAKANAQPKQLKTKKLDTTQINGLKDLLFYHKKQNLISINADNTEVLVNYLKKLSDLKKRFIDKLENKNYWYYNNEEDKIYYTKDEIIEMFNKIVGRINEGIEYQKNKSKEKPKAKTKAKATVQQPTNNIIEKFKNNMKKLIDIIYHPDVYEYSDANRVDDEERDKALNTQHKKDLFIDYKSFYMEELYYGDDEYEYSKYRNRFTDGLLNKTVKEELKKNKKLNEKVNKLKDILNSIDEKFEELMEKEGDGYNSDDE